MKTTNYDASMIVESYSKWIVETIDEGWSPVLLTFKYRPICGDWRAAWTQMTWEMERVYATLLTRMVRNTAGPTDSLPRWICVPDFPVPKQDRIPLGAVRINDGLHGHGLCLIPPFTKLTRAFETEVQLNQAMLTRQPHRLYRLDARPITHNPQVAVDYVFKMVTRGRVSFDDILILPRTNTEMAGFKAHDVSES